MNVLSAAVDYELVVRNQGAAEARGVRIALQLFTAGEHHDAELRDYLDAPADAPIVAAFDLAPGAATTVRAIALLPTEAVNVVTVQVGTMGSEERRVGTEWVRPRETWGGR